MSHGGFGHRGVPPRAVRRDRREEFLDTAQGALAYEEALFDPVVGDWPDFRGVDEPGSPPRPNLVWPRLVPWRIRELRLAGHMPSRSTRPAAKPTKRWRALGLATTLKAIDKNLRDPDHDTSLCHGLGGLMDIVLTAGTILEDSVYLDAHSEWQGS